MINKLIILLLIIALLYGLYTYHRGLLAEYEDYESAKLEQVHGHTSTSTTNPLQVPSSVKSQPQLPSLAQSPTPSPSTGILKPSKVPAITDDMSIGSLFSIDIPVKTDNKNKKKVTIIDTPQPRPKEKGTMTSIRDRVINDTVSGGDKRVQNGSGTPHVRNDPSNYTDNDSNFSAESISDILG